MEENQKILEEEQDAELVDMAREEVESLKQEKEKNEIQLKVLLLPTDPRDAKNVIMEIRAGTGGDEAGLFCADLFRMYSRYAENMKWKVEIMNSNETGVGGFKEVILQYPGQGRVQ